MAAAVAASLKLPGAGGAGWDVAHVEGLEHLARLRPAPTPNARTLIKSVAARGRSFGRAAPPMLG